MSVSIATRLYGSFYLSDPVLGEYWKVSVSMATRLHSPFDLSDTIADPALGSKHRVTKTG